VSEALSPLGDPALGALLRDLLERLERQAGEIAHFRAITAQAETARREDELSELRSRLLALESERSAPEAESAVRPPRGQGSTLRRDARVRGAQGIWLPPSARSPEASRTPTAAQPSGSPVEPTRSPLLAGTGTRVAAFVAEAVFIVAAASGAWLLDLAPIGIVAVVGVAWILVALLEWLRYGRA